MTPGRATILVVAIQHGCQCSCDGGGPGAGWHSAVGLAADRHRFDGKVVCQSFANERFVSWSLLGPVDGPGEGHRDPKVQGRVVVHAGGVTDRPDAGPGLATHREVVDAAEVQDGVAQFGGHPFQIHPAVARGGVLGSRGVRAGEVERRGDDSDLGGVAVQDRRPGGHGTQLCERVVLDRAGSSQSGLVRLQCRRLPVGILEAEPDVAQRQTGCPHRGDPECSRDLLGAVVAIPRVGIDLGREQQPLLVIEPQGPDGKARQGAERADREPR